MKNKRPTFNHPPKMQGFSLIEFLVASALSMIVLMAVTSTYFTARNLNNAATSRLSVQQDLRHASTLLVRDARMAGSFGCFNMVNYPPSAIIKDESKAPFNLASNATDKGMIPIAEVTTINSPGFSPNADSTILIFQYGIDDTAPNKNVAVFSSCNRLYKPINNNLNDASDTFSKEIGEDNKGSISILRHMVVAYAVGKFGEQEGLYRFQLNDSGNWEAPQLLIKDVTSMEREYTYVDSCPENILVDSTSTPKEENFTTINPKDPLRTNPAENEATTPALIRITLKGKGGQNIEASNENNVQIYNIDAAIRGGNTCADRPI